MTIWFTADQHYHHDNIRLYCNRPFPDVETMDRELIARHNLLVQPSDIIFHLGDFTLGNKAMAHEYFKQLNGWIRLVPGGHDESWLKKTETYYSKSGQVVDILPALSTVKVAPKTNMVLCHYPLQTWEQSHYGIPHLHGHSHGGLGLYTKWGKAIRIDVGVDCWQYQPVSLETLQMLIETAV